VKNEEFEYRIMNVEYRISKFRTSLFDIRYLPTGRLVRSSILISLTNDIGRERGRASLPGDSTFCEKVGLHG
jgi:hypothetical protein